MGDMTRRKITPYIERHLWGDIEARLYGKISPPCYVGVNGAAGGTLTATRWDSRGAQEHLLRIDGKRITPVSVTELEVDQSVVDEVLAVSRDGLEAMLVKASDLARSWRERYKGPRDRRDLALAELHLVHGWTKKVDIYKHLGVRITRYDLDNVISRTSHADLPGYPNGEVCRREALRWEEEFRRALLAETTAGRMRNALIRALVFGWHDVTDEQGQVVDYPMPKVAELAGTKTSRINQICQPDYPAYRAELKALKAGSTTAA